MNPDQINCIEMSDGRRLYVYEWVPDRPCETLLLITHGMMEHGQRYGRLAAVLKAAGIHVLSYDQRGHGLTETEPMRLGDLLPGEDWGRLVSDLREMVSQSIASYAPKEVFVLGHSMGSFVVQDYAQHQPHDRLKGVILTGTGHQAFALVYSGRLLAKIGTLLAGHYWRNKLLHLSSFLPYEWSVRQRKTPYDWLSSDESEVARYQRDVYCGFVCKSAFFHALFSGITRIQRGKNIATYPATLPLLMLGGSADPLGNGGKTLRHLVDRYRRHGATKVDFSIYEGFRHEILNETDRQLVFDRILAFVRSF